MCKSKPSGVYPCGHNCPRTCLVYCDYQVFKHTRIGLLQKCPNMADEEPEKPMQLLEPCEKCHAEARKPHSESDLRKFFSKNCKEQGFTEKKVQQIFSKHYDKESGITEGDVNFYRRLFAGLSAWHEARRLHWWNHKDREQRCPFCIMGEPYGLWA